jgi:hypothetical protein
MAMEGGFLRDPDTGALVVTGGTGGGEVSMAELTRDAQAPAGALGETGDRESASTTTALVSGTLRVSGPIALRGGEPVTSISFVTGATGATTPTNQWFALIRASDRAVLAKTVDDTTAAWAGGTVKTLAIAGGPYTPSVDEEVYVCALVVAATPPQLLGANGNAVTNTIAPVRNGSSTTGLTDPASLGATAAAIGSVSAVTPYGWVS